MIGLKQAWNDYLKIRRAQNPFYSGLNNTPLQIVYKTQKPQIYFADLRDIEEHRREDKIAAYQREDKAKDLTWLGVR